MVTWNAKDSIVKVLTKAAETVDMKRVESQVDWMNHTEHRIVMKVFSANDNRTKRGKS